MNADMINILVGCECSGRVRDAFRERGFNAFSCDLKPSADMRFHLQCDIRKALRHGPWHALIVFPDCTYLTSSGLHWNLRVPERAEKTRQALEFVRYLLDQPIEHIALENPQGCIGTNIRKADQYIQPYEFGDDASKKTGLWLKNFPLLRPTSRVQGRFVMINDRRVERWSNQTDSGQNRLGPSDDRAEKRAITYPGIAHAMAQQWGDYLLEVYSCEKV